MDKAITVPLVINTLVNNIYIQNSTNTYISNLLNTLLKISFRSTQILKSKG